jgi:formylglycine-generating enzyme required for sulfatase activity
MANPNTVDIRKFLTEFLSDEELATFCFDYFRDVYEEFAAGMAKGQKVQLLLDRCARREALPELLAALERERPEQYRKRFPENSPKPVQPQPGVETENQEASQPTPAPITEETSDKTVRHRVPPWVWVTACVVLFLLAVIVFGPSIITQTVPNFKIRAGRIAGNGMGIFSVPAGEFTMGAADGDGDADSDEKPQHEVMLGAFWIDRTEVTNAMFARFVAETSYKTDAEKSGKSWMLNSLNQWEDSLGVDWRHPRGPGSDLKGLEQHPVVNISWHDAMTYCSWAGRRLPTAAEWEKAARGTDGRRYPWGNQRVASNLLNFADRNLNVSGADKSVDDGYQFTAPVGTYPMGASPYGAEDMAGNVWEWTSSLWGKNIESPDFGYPYNSADGREDLNAADDVRRVLRGGSWFMDQRGVRATVRSGWYDPASGAGTIGFRCACSP